MREKVQIGREIGAFGTSVWRKRVLIPRMVLPTTDYSLDSLLVVWHDTDRFTADQFHTTQLLLE
jgi:hypothetical protein